MDLQSLQWSFLRPVQNNGGMSDKYRDWIAAGLLKPGKSKGGLAKAMGLQNRH